MSIDAGMYFGNNGLRYDPTVTWPPAPLSEQVADLEKRKAQVEKELADLKAKRDAEVAAKAKAKAKTYGEKVAEGIVATNLAGNLDFRDAAGRVRHVTGSTPGFTDIGIRSIFAAALDKAHADGRAEQREKDAKMFEDILRDNYVTVSDEYNRGRRNAFDFAADLIRNHE